MLLSQPSGPPRRVRRRRRAPWRALLAMTGGLVLLAAGIAIGRALEEGPSPSGTQTSVRTLELRPLAPAVTTVTVTVQKE